MKITRWAVLSIVALGVAGCGAEATDEAVEASGASIINGTVNNGDPAVMALVGQVPGQEGASLCTSTLIAPTVLLTAAHCVAAEMFQGPAQFAAIAGSDLRDPASRKVYKVKEVHWDTQFDKNAPQKGHDIGVAILESPITDIQPIPFNTQPITAQDNGRELRITGYGLADGTEQLGALGGGGAPAETSAGIKRVATTKQISVDSLTIELGATSLFGTMSGEANICSGDSGGPVFAKIGGVDTVVGVNSYGMIACLGSSRSTRVDLYLPFIQQHLGAASSR
jgi:V8-like Glu-specific endopeptidase